MRTRLPKLSIVNYANAKCAGNNNNKGDIDMAKCKHGEFDLAQGCPECIKESRHETAETEVPEAAITLRPGEDIEAHGYHLEALALLEAANERVIASFEDTKVATGDINTIARLKKLMEAKKKELLQPLKEQTDAIKDTYTFLMTPILEADKIIRSKLLDHDKEQRRIRAEQEEINRLQREAAERKAKLSGEDTPAEVVPVIRGPAKTVVSDAGSAGTTDHWKYEVVDKVAVPEEYKMIDTAMLSAIAKKWHDQKEVPGVRFYCEKIISVRGNR